MVRKNSFEKIDMDKYEEGPNVSTNVIKMLYRQGGRFRVLSRGVLLHQGQSQRQIVKVLKSDGINVA